MKYATLLFPMLLASFTPVSAQEVLAALDGQQLVPDTLPEGIAVDVVEMDGAPGVRVTYSGTGPRSVQLAEVPCDRLDNTRVFYKATMSGEDLAAPAYLEMNAVVGGNAYFSRAVNDAFVGTTPARQTAAPFVLKTGQFLEAARLGVRFEGPGAVTMSGIQLVNGGPYYSGASTGTRVGLAGTALGILTALWFIFAQQLSVQGRARGPVLAVTAVVALIGAIALLIGAVWALRGASYWSWYPLVLLGGIAAGVYGWNYPILRRRYRESEERRMFAMELVDS